jgi:hypothetical protein
MVVEVMKKSFWREQDQTVFCEACTIFMAEPISADTSVMLLGTISVVVASDATWLYASTAFSATFS